MSAALSRTERRSEDAAPAEVDADVGASPPPKPKGKKRVVIGAIGAVAVVGGGAFLYAERGHESTDDAQIEAQVVALAPRTSGVVVKVAFEENAVVKAGQVLAELDPEPAKAKLAQAEAMLEAASAAADAADADARLAETNARANKHAATASLGAASAGAVSSRDLIAEADARVVAAEASRAQAKSEFDRTSRLVSTGALSSTQLDEARTALDTAEANLAQAKARASALRSSAAQAVSLVSEATAKVDQTRDVDVVVSQALARARSARAQVAQLKAARDLAAMDLAYTKIVAPQDGVVSKKNVDVGQTVAAGSPIVMLVPSRPPWITANFKETQIGRMHDGQPVEIHVDAFPGLTLKGKVESFSAATGSRFALLPPDNASGNFTKVVQRVPVRIRFEEVPANVALRPGMSVELTVDVRK